MTQINWTMIEGGVFGLALVLSLVTGMDGGKSKVIRIYPSCMYAYVLVHAYLTD